MSAEAWGNSLRTEMVVGLLMMTPATIGICAGGSIKITDCWNSGSDRLRVATKKKGAAFAPRASRAVITVGTSAAHTTKIAAACQRESGHTERLRPDLPISITATL